MDGPLGIIVSSGARAGSKIGHFSLSQRCDMMNHDHLSSTDAFELGINPFQDYLLGMAPLKYLTDLEVSKRKVARITQRKLNNVDTITR